MSRLTVCFLSFVLLAAPAVTARSLDEDAELVDKIAAVVGDKIILLSEVMDLARPAFAEMQQASRGGAGMMTAAKKKEVIEQTLEQLINLELIKQQASQMEISVTSEEVDRVLENLASENGVDVETIKESAVAQGIDWLTFRNMKRDELLRYKVLSLRVRTRINISEAEARQFYNEQVRGVRATGTFEGAHILIRVPEGASPQVTSKARARAEAIKNEVQAGVDFGEAARRYSQDPATAKKGGSLGEMEHGAIPASLDRAFMDMEVGEVVGPIRSGTGYHILRLSARESLGVQPFSEVKERIMSQLTQREMMRQEQIWLKELRLKTFIDIRL